MGVSGKDDKHIISVQDGEYYVLHPKKCKVVNRKYESLFGEPVEIEEYDCNIDYHISYWGLDDLTDQYGNEVTHPEKLPEGEYKLVLSWIDSQSFFEDNEVNFWIER